MLSQSHVMPLPTGPAPLRSYPSENKKEQTANSFPMPGSRKPAPHSKPQARVGTGSWREFETDRNPPRDAADLLQLHDVPPLSRPSCKEGKPIPLAPHPLEDFSSGRACSSPARRRTFPSGTGPDQVPTVDWPIVPIFPRMPVREFVLH